MYITYDEYQNLGGVCELTAFNRNIDRVCGLINNATFGRVKAMQEVPQEVKACCRDLVEYLHNNAATTGTVSSRSQTAGGVSESENYNIKDAEVQKQEMHDIIYDYLLFVTDDNGTPLLYRGCMK